MEKVQITFFHKDGKYRPIARIVEVENWQEYENNKAKYQKQAMLNVCHSKHMTPQEFLNSGYTKVKADTVENIQRQKNARAIEYYFNKRNKGVK